MPFATWPSGPSGPVLATAIHAGHWLRPEVAGRLAIDPAARLREEDPATDRIAAAIPSTVVVHRSRFEVDLNRPPDEAVYRGGADAWGDDPWASPPPPGVVEASRRLHAAFYQRLGAVIDAMIDSHGGFVLYDVHSYNHRRNGPAAPPEPEEANPQVNLGTGSLPPRWRPVAEEFLTSMGKATSRGGPVDARENVKFEGRHLAGHVHDRYGDHGCVLAVEFKKEYMDEWTGIVDDTAVAELGYALAGTTAPVWEAATTCR